MSRVSIGRGLGALILLYFLFYIITKTTTKMSWYPMSPLQKPPEVLQETEARRGKILIVNINRERDKERKD